MNKKEAIELLKGESCYGCSWGCESPIECENKKCNVRLALGETVDVLEKQIPQRPLRIANYVKYPDDVKYDVFVCPSCVSELVEGYKYCPRCGQRLGKYEKEVTKTTRDK